MDNVLAIDNILAMDNVLTLETISALTSALALDSIVAIGTSVCNAWYWKRIEIARFLVNGYCIALGSLLAMVDGT